ncbi:MAG TPA: AAA family ATPase [Mycobacteriales bacterium]
MTAAVSAAGVIMAAVTTPAGPLVGRERELGVLLDALAAARSGSGGAVLVGGDAGVGKTRLVREALDAAAAAGDVVLVGHCMHFGGDTVPYLPLTEALARLLRTDPVALEALLSSWPTLARLVPGRVSDTGAVEGTELYEAVLGAVLDLSATQALVLVVEDVHWADAATRDLLGFLLTRSPGEHVTVVLTVRTDDLHRKHPLRPSLAEWGRLPGVRRLPLAPLAADEVRALVAAQHPGPLSDAAVASILDRSGGNPFFAEQLLAEIDTGNSIPADLADLLLVRLERLSREARHVVRVAAVAGRRVTHETLTRVADRDRDALEAALREAAEAHILVPSGPESYEFRHALLAESVYDDLLPGERVRLHRAYAQAQADQGDDANLARHAREALDLPTAYAASLRAGERAMRLAAPAEALRLFESALAMADQVPDSDRLAVARRAAEAAALAGHPFRTVHLLEEALAQAGDAPDEVRAELLLTLAAQAAILDGQGDPTVHSAAALALIPPDAETPLRARALAAHAQAEAAVARYRDALRSGGEALALGRTLRLADVIADASTTLAHASARLGERDAATRMFEESVHDAVVAGDAAGEIRAWYALGGQRYDDGDLDGSLDAYGRSLARAQEAGRPWSAYAMDGRAMQVLLLHATGRWDDAVALAATPDAPGFVQAYVSSALLSVLVGRGDPTVDQTFDGLRPWLPRDGFMRIIAAYAELEHAGIVGDTDRAVRVHDETVSVLAEQWQEHSFAGRIRLNSLLLPALDPGAEGTVDRAARLVDEAHATLARLSARQAGVGPEAPAWDRRIDAEWARLRWLADADPPSAEELTGRWREAVSAFGYGHVYEQARSRAGLAEALAAVGDDSGARAETEAALQVARRLGAAPLVTRLRFRTSPAPRAHELTPREHQVLALLAEGLTNRQIGARLYITDKTVSVHVSNILAKLGAGGRTQAAAIARREGLI